MTRELTAEFSSSGLREAPTRAKSRPVVTMNDIHCLAFRKWNAAGRPTGDCTRFWLEAERDLVEGPPSNAP